MISDWLPFGSCQGHDSWQRRFTLVNPCLPRRARNEPKEHHVKPSFFGMGACCCEFFSLANPHARFFSTEDSYGESRYEDSLFCGESWWALIGLSKKKKAIVAANSSLKSLPWHTHTRTLAFLIRRKLVFSILDLSNTIYRSQQLRLLLLRWDASHPVNV